MCGMRIGQLCRCSGDGALSGAEQRIFSSAASFAQQAVMLDWLRGHSESISLAEAIAIRAVVFCGAAGSQRYWEDHGGISL